MPPFAKQDMRCSVQTLRHFEQQIGSMPAPYFALPSGLGRRVGIDQYRSRYNIVLCFLDDANPAATARALQAFAAHRPRYQRNEAEVLVLLAASIERVTELQQSLSLPYPLLADPERRTRALFAKLLPQQPPDGPLFFVLDRFNAPFAALGDAQPEDPALQQELLDWLALIEVQCPE
jgi:peroxiredoxin